MPLPPLGFDYNVIPLGYYQQVLETGSPIRKAWHLQKFERVIECLPKMSGQSILDIGCFAGTFLSLLPQKTFKTQLGVDILEKQIDYANERFGTSYRSFRYIPSVSELGQIHQTFDCITLIEVIEHLTEAEICELFRQIDKRLNTGGTLVLSTPNYLSLWPLLEIAVNRLSDVSYAEQHVTKFSYPTCVSKLKRISETLASDFELMGRTTTHFLSPFLAALSFSGAMRLSRLIPFKTWKNPLGSLILLSFRKTAGVQAEPDLVPFPGVERNRRLAA
ncbi:MAG: methyltransferase domain-containing protein [Planctomycetaceae bacterium]|nr:methyltransferase domain-containing protein [Planctomycetaceae bacterium]